jgi:hypothetical protein
MTYIPQTGIGATLTLDAITYRVRSMSITPDRDLIDRTALSDIYKVFSLGRVSFTCSAELYLSADAANSIATSFLGVATLGTAVSFTYEDASGFNSYSGNCFVNKFVQNSKGDDMEIISVEFTSTDTVN